MGPLDLVALTALMERTSGIPEVTIGLIDGPVQTEHRDLAVERLRVIAGSTGASCAHATSTACRHGTFVTGILFARRNSVAPAICPDCTLLLRPIFAEGTSGSEQVPSARPKELAQALMDCIGAGARIINLSLALAKPSMGGDRSVEDALDHAVKRGVIVVAAAGNQATLGGSVITRHPWVIPVVACDCRGVPMDLSNLGRSIGRRGLRAPGHGITSLSTNEHSLSLGGTSVAVPFVTGAAALLWSAFPSETAVRIKLAMTQVPLARRASVVPPLLDGAASYQLLSRLHAAR